MSPSEIWQFMPAIAEGLATTLILCAVASCLGLIVGLLVAVADQFCGRLSRMIISSFVEFFRNTPLLLQLMWIQFSLPMLTGLNMPPRISAIVGLTLSAIAIAIEIFRAGLLTVPRGQSEAAYALGLRRWQTIRLVAFPQALQAMLPAITNMVLSLLRGTTVASILAVGELVQVANRISVYTFHPVEVYTSLMLVYLAIGFVIDQLGRFIEMRYVARITR